MEVLYYLMIFLILGLVILLINHYAVLYRQKDTFSKKELFFIISILLDQIQIIFSKGSRLFNWSIFILAAIIGSWMPYWGNIFGYNNDSWFFNSCLPFLIAYYLIPNVFSFDNLDIKNSKMAKNLLNAVHEKFDILTFGFGLAYSSYLVFNWGIYRFQPFLWNTGNALIIVFFMLKGLGSRENLNDNNRKPDTENKEKPGNEKIEPPKGLKKN